MAAARGRGTTRARWQRDIVERLEDFPRQYDALEHAMAAFGTNFALDRFKQAFNTTEDMDAYNRVQALERAVGRVQGYVAELAESGAKLAQLELAPSKDDGSRAPQAFDALRQAQVIDGPLSRRLIRAQKARSAIEYSYVRTNAGDVHRAAELVHEAAREFIGRYREWIEEHLRT